MLENHTIRQLNVPVPRHPSGAGFTDEVSFPGIDFPPLVHTHDQMPFLLQWPSV
jgi:hypothetical protein